METFETRTDLPAPPQGVWAALTQKRLVDRYYLAPLSADLTGAGQTFHYGPPDAAMISCSILAFDPGRRLAHSFRFAGSPPPASEVVYTLASSGSGTALTLTHAGLLPGSEDLASIEAGWPIILTALAEVLHA